MLDSSQEPIPPEAWDEAGELPPRAEAEGPLDQEYDRFYDLYSTTNHRAQRGRCRHRDQQRKRYSMGQG